MAENRPAFREQLQTKWDEGKFLCVGLDPDIKNPKFPAVLKDLYQYPQNGFGEESAIGDFVEKIIKSTGDLVCAFKPNIAFYESFRGGEGLLRDAIIQLHASFPDVPVIGDVKRADIGNTNQGYARMAFEKYNLDAITTNPYFGHDTYPPFLDPKYGGRGLIVLCKTTNPGAAMYQDVPVNLDMYYHQQKLAGNALNDEEMDLAEEAANHYREEIEQTSKEFEGLWKRGTFLPLYRIIALRTATLAKANPNIALVVGATHPEAFEPVRNLAADVPFLIPGIGTQGGDLEKTLRYAPDRNGQGMIINSASGIIFASAGEDFAEAAKVAAVKLHTQIQELRAVA